jgi:hypothetical protein
MWLRKTAAGTAAGHVWDKDGAVAEVSDELGSELLAMPGGGFAEVDAPKRPAKTETPKTDDAGDGAQSEADDGCEPDKPQRRTRAKKPVEE